MTEHDEVWGGKHDPVTALHAAVARVQERLSSVIERLERHMTDEHADFRDALKEMKALQASVLTLDKKIDQIHVGAQVTRFIIGAIAAVISWIVVVKAGIVGFLTGK